MPEVLRPIVDEDLAGVLELNRLHVPHVGPLDADRLRLILDECSLALVAVDQEEPSGKIAGMVLVLPPGAGYDSPNYLWFAEHHDDFRYVDRIAVSADSQRHGLGRRLYDAVFAHAREQGARRVTAEVNLEPPNPVSLAFHTQLGFAEVGRQDTYDGAVRVALLSAPVAP